MSRRATGRDGQNIDQVEFRVIGELRRDPGHLLLLDHDGQCYDYDLFEGRIEPIDPDCAWEVDAVHASSIIIDAPTKIAS